MPPTPAQPARAMRAQAMPGENPGTLPKPAEIARRILPMASADLTHTGRIYQARHERWVEHQQPGIVAS